VKRKPAREYKMFLDDMNLAMSRITEYTDGMDFSDFKLDYKTSDAVIRNFEVIGEAAKNIPKSIKSKYPEIPWIEMYLLRNKVSHEYFGIDYEIIWDVVKNYLPDNMRQIELILNLEF
jgi:uncharacterized protein with HEPN domain